MRRCEACDGAGHLERTDVRLCAARPELGAGGPILIDCPDCDGRGWLSDTPGEPEPERRPHREG